MQVIIEDFGPVRRFDFDSSKLFQLIVGNNNVGKSYVLSAYYFVIKSMLESAFLSGMQWRYIELFDGEDEPEVVAKAEAFDKLFRSKSPRDVDATEYYEVCVSETLKNSFLEVFARYIKGSFSEVGSIANKLRSGSSAKITVVLPKLSFTITGDIGAMTLCDVKVNHKVLLRESKQKRDPAIQNGNLVIYRPSGYKENASRVRGVALTRTITMLQEGLNGFRDIHYLPASRSGLYQALSAFGQIIAELSKSRSFLSSKIELPAIPVQLSDYFIKLTSIPDSPGESDPELAALADRIEEGVLKGQIEYDFEEKRLYYRPEGTDLRLDLSSTSSMVSEIGPIVVYIRHIIANLKGVHINPRSRLLRKGLERQKTILVIEEPEAHLHPDNQLKMTELYADLAKAGVHIVMTSHSNYIFNKLSNIILGGGLSAAQVKCDLIELVEGGNVGKSQGIDEFGIDDNNFADASELLLGEKLDLLGKVQ
jgi:hypothetical protein